MSVFQNVDVVRPHHARKVHRCDFCSKGIEPGDRYWKGIGFPGAASHMEPDGYYDTIDWPFTELKACQTCWLTPEWA